MGIRENTKVTHIFSFPNRIFQKPSSRVTKTPGLFDKRLTVTTQS